ncbi:MAG TPA: ATP-binding protein [Bacteroidales bacterium]
MSALKFKSIRTSLLVLILLIFIPMFAVVFHSAWQYKMSAKQFASESALRVARNLAEQQKLIESNTNQFLEVLSQLPEVKSGDSTQINHLFSTLLLQNPSYASLLMVNQKGDMIASGSTFVKINVSDRKYFQDAIHTKSFAIGEYTRGRLTRKPVIHYAFPVTKRDGTIQSILVVSFDLKYYDEIFRKSNLGDDATFTFVDHRGVIIYQSANQTGDIGLNEEPDIMSKVIGEKTELTFLANGKDAISRLYGCERLSLKGEQPYMYIFVGVPEKIAYYEFHKIITFNTVMWILITISIIISAYLFSVKFIIHPIDQLVKTAGLIAEGKLETRTGVTKSKTELGKLAIAIDEMTDNLYRREMEQKKTQKDLRRLKERFELAINSAHIGIWDWHIRNNTLLWDNNMFNLYGIQHDGFDFRFESWMQLVHTDDVKCLEEKIKEAIETHNPFRSEFRINHPKLGVKFIRIFANVIDDKEGKPVRLIGVNWDITERKALERKLQEAKDRAETSDRLKSAFLANISHEIRTPLHGIIGFAQILKENEIAENDRMQFLNIVIDSGNKLMRIISNIIDISMLDAGQLKIQQQDHNLNTLLKEIYTDFEKIRVAEKREFKFIIESEIGETISMAVDDFRFRQIFSNLIDNAFKFTHQGEIKMGCRTFNGELLCYVKDSGIGVSKEDLLKIFDRFKQVDDSNNRIYSGSGLGLAICKGLLDLMGGRIWAVSKETGSEFYFSLPLKTIEETQSITSSEDSLFA